MSLTLEEALASLRVLALPMRTTFRSLDIRETALFKGENGWGEFAPFVEYSDQESLPWLESAIEAADKPLSPALRESIPINATVPASNDEAETVSWAREMLRHSPMALRLLKAGLNAADDGLAGVQQLAGDATLLFYLTEEGQEGRDAYKEKREPDFNKFPKRP